VPTGKDLDCGTRDDPFMMRLGKHLIINELATQLVGEEYNRLASKSPDRLYQTPTPMLPVNGYPVDIRNRAGEPLQFTLPGRCNEPFYCFQGNQCKDPAEYWGTYSHSAIVCIPVP
jgi:hypothetical protein